MVEIVPFLQLKLEYLLKAFLRKIFTRSKMRYLLLIRNCRIHIIQYRWKMNHYTSILCVSLGISHKFPDVNALMRKSFSTAQYLGRGGGLPRVGPSAWAN